MEDDTAIPYYPGGGGDVPVGLRDVILPWAAGYPNANETTHTCVGLRQGLLYNLPCDGYFDGEKGTLDVHVCVKFMNRVC